MSHCRVYGFQLKGAIPLDHLGFIRGVVSTALKFVQFNFLITHSNF